MGRRKRKIGWLSGLILAVAVIVLSLTGPEQVIGHIKSGPGSQYDDQGHEAVLASAGHNFRQLRAGLIQKKASGSLETLSADRSALAVQSQDQRRLIPGGQSIGIRVATHGVLVVGYHLVPAASGKPPLSPGEIADIRIGDVITKINGTVIRNVADIQRIIPAASSSRPLKIDVLRRNSLIRKNLVPVQNNGQNQLGLNIRDSASGIGTLTYYDPVTSGYGALGHVISDHDTGQPILIRNGNILKASVMAIEKGVQGKPGEKIALFSDHARTIGTVEENTPFGIFGHFEQPMQRNALNLQEALPVAHPSQVREGPAKILTVLSGNRVQAFNIRILNAETQKKPGTKGLVIKITDPRLLKVTGGIIQGMSGSPIIQNGMIVGAVTHVFVNDPTCGYGVHIEWMLRESGLEETRKSEERAS
ncbi:SpoIVB peptidase [Sporolactobacillus vineae]|uniref:SpoIVB peptidase n=1 Tax=Sporolactobacillus vineae TaxID=444463 RepID=UPI000287FB05|nr:SpoIVB peptidase [Sporolactobacillus vineae]